MKPVHLRILSYNIHKGFSARQQFTLEAMREAIELVHADLVLLQEVQGDHSEKKTKVKNWPSVSQFEFLADRLWPHYAYGKNSVYAKGHHGNAILSKYPISFSENVNISTNRFERRGMLHAILEVPELGTHVHAICVHMDLLQAGRERQIQKLIERIHAVVPHDAPLIIGGDFNDWREKSSEALHTELGLEEVFQVRCGSHARTFPVWFPFLRLDRIYYRGVHVQDVQCLTGKPWNSLSDHAALFADVLVKPMS
ncbi:MAG TPA: endonuclease/exonuclease/phosphatase family protein [Bdellovibrionales bacterium]|nr:endonuclease/exonuclease/phosphatase family protein [Bdellovibrionales bacterium]